MILKKLFYIYLFVTYIAIISPNFAGEDSLPKHLTPQNKKTMVNYEELRVKLKKYKKAQQNIFKDKEIYNLKTQKEFNLFEYIKTASPALDLPLIELQYKESEFKIISLIYPLSKPIKSTPIISQYYNLASYDLQKQIDCFITPTLKNISANQPKSFNITNNLRRKTSSPFVAAGDIIYIKGKVTDINCTPIANAVINIWQADSYGRYDNKLEKYFLGNGTAISDNMGNFEFITILPANTSQISAPHINLSANHDNFNLINTKMFFGNNILNVTDETRKDLDWFNKSLITAEILPVDEQNLARGFYMLFNLTFNGVAPYKNVL